MFEFDRLDETRAIRVADDIWWVGFADREAGFSNNPYLLVDGDEAVLFDPGPGHPFFRDLILRKIEEVIDPRRVRFIVVHHQDPDLCGLIPHLEDALHPELLLLATQRTALFLPYYGSRISVHVVADHDQLELTSGRRIRFLQLPYVHSAGNMVSFDEKSGSLFSSDLFAVLDRDWSLGAKPRYREAARSFLEAQVCSSDALRFAWERLSTLPISRILPQHGGVIFEDVADFVDILKDTNPGRLLRTLLPAPSDEELRALVRQGWEWAEGAGVVPIAGFPTAQDAARFSQEGVAPTALEDLFETVGKSGAENSLALSEFLAEEAGRLGVSNPVTTGRIHRASSLVGGLVPGLVERVRRELLAHQREEGEGGQREWSVEGQGGHAYEESLAVLFADIRGFSAWAARHSPDDVLRMLNHHFDSLGAVMSSHGGRVNKLFGDGMLAYFPAARLADAIKAALRIHVAVARENLLPCGVGVTFGSVIVGEVGQQHRYDHTLIGEAVNTAARLSTAAEGGVVLCSMACFRALSGPDLAEILKDHESSLEKVRVKPDDPEIEVVALLPR